MHRLVLARECGHDAEGLDDVTLARWTRLEADPKRHIDVPFCDDGFTFIDIDPITGVLLLCGGRKDNQNSTSKEPALAIYRYPQPNVPPDTTPLVVAGTSPPNTSSAYITSASWYPHDNALFLTGMHTQRQVDVWDTERFTTVASFKLGPEPNTARCVHAVSFSPVPSARGELAATACHDLPHVTLLDLNSGSTTHVLRSDHPLYPVHDVKWSSTNPHQLASIDTSGQVALFDVRRSGTVSCLLTMSAHSPPMPKPGEIPIATKAYSKPPTQANRPSGVRKKRSRTQRETAKPPLQTGTKAPTLGLACAWRPVSCARYESLMGSRRSTGASAHSEYTPTSAKAIAKLQFTRDGMTILSRIMCKGFFAHDVITGRLLSSFRSGATTSPFYEAHLGFEMARDGDHIITNFQGALCMLDVRDGGLVHMTEQRTPELQALTLHPFEEEVFSVHSGRITCWSDGLRELESENEQRRYVGGSYVPAMTYWSDTTSGRDRTHPMSNGTINNFTDNDITNNST